MSTTKNVSIQLRNDETANWEANSGKVLLAGEVGVEFADNNKTKIKIGDGTTTWENLKYFGGVDNKTYIAVVTDDATDSAAIAAQVGSNELQVGDMAIVKRQINADKFSHTAYVYQEGGWAAMDGNYNAENVYFDTDLTYTANIGVKTVPSSGSGTISAAGKNVKEVLASILAQEKNPGKTNPSCSVTLTGGNKSLEVGSKVTPEYTTGFNAGSYTYGPATGVTATSYSVVFNGETKDTASGSFSEYTVAEGSKNITLTVGYSEGAIPKTNLGNNYEAGKIVAGTCNATSAHNISGYRNMFYGPMTDAAAELNSANIRALSGKKATANGAIPTFGVVDGTKKVVVAVPSAKKITKVLMPSALNADVTSNFVLQSGTVNVEGANGYTAAAYKVYVFQPASITTDMTFAVTIG